MRTSSGLWSAKLTTMWLPWLYFIPRFWKAGIWPDAKAFLPQTFSRSPQESAHWFLWDRHLWRDSEKKLWHLFLLAASKKCWCEKVYSHLSKQNRCKKKSARVNTHKFPPGTNIFYDQGPRHVSRIRLLSRKHNIPGPGSQQVFSSFCQCNFHHPVEAFLHLLYHKHLTFRRS